MCRTHEPAALIDKNFPICGSLIEARFLVERFAALSPCI